MNNNFDKNFIQYSDKAKKEETKSIALYLTVHITFYIIILFFAVFFSWYTVFISTHSFYTISGESMMPTFNAQLEDSKAEDKEKVSYDAIYVDRSTRAKVFDVIVMREQVEGSSVSVIKRLMAEGGDYISLALDNKSNQVHFYRIAKDAILGEVSDEEAMLDETTNINGYHIKDQQEWTNKFFFSEIYDTTEIGDYKYVSNFVSYYMNLSNQEVTLLQGGQNLAKRSDIYVSETGLVYVKVPEGKIFYLGDNRANSRDSMWYTEFCDEKNIIGRGEIVVKDYNFANRIWEVVKFYFSEVEKFFAK